MQVEPSLERGHKPRENREDATKVPENANTGLASFAFAEFFDFDLPKLDCRSPIQLSVGIDQVGKRWLAVAKPIPAPDNVQHAATVRKWPCTRALRSAAGWRAEAA